MKTILSIEDLKREKSRIAKAKWNSKNKELLRIRRAIYNATNKEAKKKSNAAWRASNPQKAKECAAASYKKNAEKVKERIADWAKTNAEIYRVYKQNRRARKLASGGKLSSGLAKKLFAMQKGKCACCGQPLGDDYHLDHIMPLALGGSNTDDNIQLLRARCNGQKSAKHPVDFMQQRGFLL